MVNEPYEEPLLGAAPTFSDASWDDMLSTTFSAPPGFADYLVDTLGFGDEDLTADADGTIDADADADDTIDPDAWDSDELDIEEGSTDSADDVDDPADTDSHFADDPLVDDGDDSSDITDFFSALPEPADDFGTEGNYDIDDQAMNHLDGIDDIELDDLGS